jgi:ABC-type Mn2+/Zn2+ transport system ATPase subunit
MRLRYFRIRNKAPHQDTQIVFGKEDLLGLQGSLHFLVGINGTGKSRLLQTLVETLMCFESNKEPSYPVTLAYDLPHPETAVLRTILFHKSGTRAVLYEYDHVVRYQHDQTTDEEKTFWLQLENDLGMFKPEALGTGRELWSSGQNWVTMSIYLPSAVLVYTSGAIGSWESLFVPQRINQDDDVDLLREATLEQELTSFLPGSQTSDAVVNAYPMTVWIRGEDYRAALLAAALDTASKEFDGVLRTDTTAFIEQRRAYRQIGRAMPERYDSSFRTILDEIDWLYPISVSLTLTRDVADEDPVSLILNQDENRRNIREVLDSIATSSRTTPLTETFHFDLRSRVNNENTAKRLLRALSGSIQGDAFNPFEGLRQMLFWQRKGYFQTKDIRITLKKLDVPDPITLENLSDGERMFIGRMALMQLIGDTKNTLVILDEPETHFNDYWKREMVDIIDRTLEKQNTDVLLTTHSSIALTDAFSKEINRLFKSKQMMNLIQADHPKDPTFGATPTEVLQEIFEGPRAVGQRAAEFLDTLLMLFSNPEEVIASWQNGNTATEALKTAMYEDLLPEEEMGWSESDQQKARDQLDYRLGRTLVSLAKYGETHGYPINERLLSILKNDVLRKVGAGYYRFEFSRRLRILDDPTTESTIPQKEN